MVAEQIDATGPPALHIRELARGHLPLIMPERSITVGALLGRNEDIGVLVNGQDPVAIRRQSARERNRRRHKGETVDSTPEPVPAALGTPAQEQAKEKALQDAEGTKKARRTRKHHPSRETIKRDRMLERAVPLVPLMAHLVALCEQQDARRGAFIDAYCQLLSTSPQGVTEERLAELAAAEPFVMTARTGYRWLAWAYALFSTWAFAEYQAGHVFRDGELAPMRLYVESQRPGWLADGLDEEHFEQS